MSRKAFMVSLLFTVALLAIAAFIDGWAKITILAVDVVYSGICLHLYHRKNGIHTLWCDVPPRDDRRPDNS